MINFDTTEPNIRKAMGVTYKDIHSVLDILYKSGDATMVWLIQRVWIDETLSDNARCFLIFHIGVLWEKFNKSKGKPGETTNWWN